MVVMEKPTRTVRLSDLRVVGLAENENESEDNGSKKEKKLLHS